MKPKYDSTNNFKPEKLKEAGAATDSRKLAANHTPTPWYISNEENGITTIRGDVGRGRLFAVADTLKRGDAEFIVRAVNNYERTVNSHEELVLALKQLASVANEKGMDRTVVASLVAQAWKAIAKAESVSSKDDGTEGK